jgi:tetratricopeptide (TPR) repeat protein
MNSVEKNRQKKLKNLENLFNSGNMDIVIPEASKLADEYQSAIAYNIYALAHKKLGNYALAQDTFEKLLVNNPTNILFLGNLANIYYDTGRIDKAEELFKRTLAIDPKNLTASISLADISGNRGDFDEALLFFNSILEDKDKLMPIQLNDINYRVADVYRRKGNKFYDEAIKYYSISNHPLSSAHKLELIYSVKDKIAYFEEERKINANGDLNPLLASVQTHASIRYETTDKNLFCKDPFKYIHHSKLTPNEGFTDKLIEDLLKIKNTLNTTNQSLIDNGQQSAGNLLLLNDPSAQIIKEIILNRIKKYLNSYKNVNDGFVNKWPKKSTLHGWIIELKKGGSLGSHMHKEGWLSGSLYLKLNKPSNSNQGNIIFDLKGATYPSASKSFPSKEYNIEKGDIVLFPSSIFHKTVPFESEETRVTLAFDIKPNF